MKFSFIKNDKSTVLDEIIILIVVLICLAAGLFLVITGPEFWIISADITKSLGVICIMLAVMFIPAVIYRFFTNDKKRSKVRGR